MSFPLHWQYPSTGSPPPSPGVVSTIPTYFGGQPTPPLTPPRLRGTRTVDDYAPCPPTPRCVPSDAPEDEQEWSNTLDSGPSQSTLTLSRDWFASELDRATVFADALTVLALDANDRDDVSDNILYDLALYAYPNPVLVMIERATLDLSGLRDQPVNPWACGKSFKLFSLAAGHLPITANDEKSFDYYALTEPFILEPSMPYCFTIGSILALQQQLREGWRAVYPEPIPPVIIRLNDFIGPYYLNRREDGYIYVVPTEDSIWSTICQRAIDTAFRPINPSATVETDISLGGDALYYPQHIVASKFAVNVFLELPNYEIGSTPRCEYLGAYVLQVVDGLTIDRAVGADINPEVQQSVFNRVPHLFKHGKRSACHRPRLPYVHFCYYHWDLCVIQMALDLNFPWTPPGIAEYELEIEDFDLDDDTSTYSADGLLTDEDTPSSSSVYSREPEYTSFLDLSSCE